MFTFTVYNYIYIYSLEFNSAVSHCLNLYTSVAHYYNIKKIKDITFRFM